MKFLCDQMLVRLGRWLRAAGYDTVIIEKSKPDKEILNQAIVEKRLLLTRDRHFLKMKEGQELIIFFEANTVRECAQHLTKKVPIQWTLAPFTRCLLCNTPFEDASENHLKKYPPPEDIKGSHFLFCPTCVKIYWEGSHTKRMLEVMHSWQKEAPPP